MSDIQTENSKKKPVIIAVSVILAVAVVFISVFSLSAKKDDDSDKKAGTTFGTTAGTSATYTSSDSNNAVAAPERDNIPQAISTTAASDRKDGSALPAGTASQFIKGAEATNRWKATSVISSVTVERVKVNLNVYEKGKKTDEVKSRYMYVASVETRPSRIDLISAKQVTPDKISGMPDIIRGFEKRTNENILFACSNELCSRDGTNPNGNTYYNDKNNLEATVVKDRVLAQQGKPSVSLAIYEDGKWDYPVRISLSTSADLIKFGVTNTVSYTYPVIWDGKKYKNETEISYDIWNDRAITPEGDVSSDRTLIGKVDKNHYVFLISDGFSGGYLIDYMTKDLGAKYAYWGAGGYATGMYVKGYGVITSNNYIAHGDLFCVK